MSAILPYRLVAVALIGLVSLVVAGGPGAAQISNQRPAAQLQVPVAGSAPAHASDVTLEGVELKIGEILYRVPRMVVRGTPLSRDELLRLLDPASPEPLAERVGRMAAQEISAPTVISEATTPRGRQRATYRDVLFTNVGAGRIGSVTAAEGDLEAPDPTRPMTGRFGAVSLKDLDLGRILATFGGGPSADTVLRPIHGAFSLADLRLADPTGFTVRIGRLAAASFAARPTGAGWTATMEAVAASPDPKVASPAERRRSMTALAEILESFRLGTLDMTDIAIGSETGEGPVGRIARILFTPGGENGDGGTITLEGLDVVASDVRVRWTGFSLGKLTLKPLVAALQDMAQSPNGELSPAGLRRMAPMIGSLGLSGLAIEAGEPGSRQAGAERRWQPIGSLGTFAMETGAPVEDLPSDIRLTLKGAAFAVPANPGSEPLGQLASLGYTRADLSASIHLGWDPARQELVVHEVAADGQDMGSVMLRAVVGGVGRDVFNPDSAVASVALLGAAAKSAEVTLDNRGLFERFVARAAQRQRRTPEDIRREYGTAAMIGIPAILGNAPAAKMLGQAVARFVAKPGRLTVRARARQPGGYGIADFTAGPDAASVLNALEITATAE